MKRAWRNEALMGELLALARAAEPARRPGVAASRDIDDFLSRRQPEGVRPRLASKARLRAGEMLHAIEKQWSEEKGENGCRAVIYRGGSMVEMAAHRIFAKETAASASAVNGVIESALAFIMEFS